VFEIGIHTMTRLFTLSRVFVFSNFCRQFAAKNVTEFSDWWSGYSICRGWGGACPVHWNLGSPHWNWIRHPWVG